jgi:hypothetical protein
VPPARKQRTPWRSRMAALPLVRPTRAHLPMESSAACRLSSALLDGPSTMHLGHQVGPGGFSGAQVGPGGRSALPTPHWKESRKLPWMTMPTWPGPEPGIW